MSLQALCTVCWRLLQNRVQRHGLGPKWVQGHGLGYGVLGVLGLGLHWCM